MTWSPLVTSVSETSDRSSRTQSVKGVVLHHAATTSLSGILGLFQPGGRTVSAHLAVKDGQRVGAVPEQFRAWSLGSEYWDSWAMTVECANESSNGWTISAASHESLAQLVADWARRYKFTPHRSGDPKGWTVLGHREVYTIHGDSYATACPGGMDLNYIVKRAQELLGSKPAGGGGTAVPIPEALEGVDMPAVIKRTEGVPEWSLVFPSLAGPSKLERGYVATTDPKRALWWERFYALGHNTADEFNKADYVAAQGYARKDHAAWLSAQPVATSGVVEIDYAKLAALIKIPTATENGAAARAAIVK